MSCLMKKWTKSNSFDIVMPNFQEGFFCCLEPLNRKDAHFQVLFDDHAKHMFCFRRYMLHHIWPWLPLWRSMVSTLWILVTTLILSRYLRHLAIDMRSCLRFSFFFLQVPDRNISLHVGLSGHRPCYLLVCGRSSLVSNYCSSALDFSKKKITSFSLEY